MHSEDNKSVSTTEEKSIQKKHTFLPEDFTPGENDIIIGKGMRCYNHRGNIMFRCIIKTRLKEYAYASSKRVKSELISSIVSHIKSNGAFVKKDPDTSLWYEADDFLARDKTSQAIRKIMMYNSTTSRTSKSRTSIHESRALQDSSLYKVNSEFYNRRSHHHRYHHNHHFLPSYNDHTQPKKHMESSAIDDFPFDIVGKIARSIPSQFLSDENPFEPVPVSEIFSSEQYGKAFSTSNWNIGRHNY